MQKNLSPWYYDGEGENQRRVHNTLKNKHARYRDETEKKERGKLCRKKSIKYEELQVEILRTAKFCASYRAYWKLIKLPVKESNLDKVEPDSGWGKLKFYRLT